MAKIDNGNRPAGWADADGPSGAWRRRLAGLCAALQDCLWQSDEKFAAERGWTATRSGSGWSVRVRDSRFDLRQECSACDGTGRHRITGAECPDCDATGVVTLPADDGGERR
jgi:hypothetical protein